MVKINLTKIRSYFLILTFLCFYHFTYLLNLNAQEIEVSAKVDSNNYLIGDWIRFRIDIKYKSGIKINYPTVLDSIQGLEIIERSPTLVKKQGDNVIETLHFTFTAFDTGVYVIPQLNFEYYIKNDSTKKLVSTSPIPIFVHNIGVDPTKDIKDIKPPLKVPISINEIIKYFLLVLLIIIVLFAAYYYKHRKEKNILEVFKTPKRPPHEIAIEALQALESERLWQRGEVKQYHSKITDIIRTYIEDRYQVKALESTTDEILEDLTSTKNLDEDIINKLREMLVRADLVKFAKAQPLADENEKSLQLAYEFVKDTIPVEQFEESAK